MSVYQVEQYYVHLGGLLLNEDQGAEVAQFIEDQGFYDYSIDIESVTVDGFESDSDAESFEAELNSAIDNAVNK